MLEDTTGDILEKARQGLGLGVDTLCRQADIAPDTYAALLRGAPPEDDTLEALAAVLRLNAQSLLMMSRGLYRCVPALLPAALERIETRRDGYAANCYLLKHPFAPACLLFDTGFEAAPLLEAIERTHSTLKGIFITHAHPDHTGGLTGLRKRFANVQVYVPEGTQDQFSFAEPIAPGERILFEKMPLMAIGTPGHTAASLAYFWDNPDWPMVFVGDALFAGSMGGAAHGYETALHSGDFLLTLPPSTLVCPGHGPYTTVQYELTNNPFLSERVRPTRLSSFC